MDGRLHRRHKAAYSNSVSKSIVFVTDQYGQ